MITSRQRQTLLFIQDYQRENGGISPSFKEIGNGINIKSKSSIYTFLDGLEERGFIRRLPDRARAIEILRPIERYQAFRYNRDTQELERLAPS